MCSNAKNYPPIRKGELPLKSASTPIDSSQVYCAPSGTTPGTENKAA